MNKPSSYYTNMIQAVINKSENKTWEQAVLEWKILYCEEDDDKTESCVCGKEELRYLYTIENTSNGNILFPIGSSCIRKFGRVDLEEDAAIQEKLFKLFSIIENNQKIIFSSDNFSRKLLEYFYDSGAFKPSMYNNNNSKKDYNFLVKMFNKRNKHAITAAQYRKITAIVLSSIKPFLNNLLQSKIRRKKQPTKNL